MQRGFSLIEVIFFCFGISILATVILPRGLNFFQRTTMFFETQRLRTNLRFAQDFSATASSEIGALDFPSIYEQSGEIRFQIDSDEHGYSLFEKQYSRRKILQRKFPNWIQVNMNTAKQIYFLKAGTLRTIPSLDGTTITLSRNGSMQSGEKYHVILHTNGRIRTDFKFPNGN